MTTTATSRLLKGVTVVDIIGSITVDQGSAVLRSAVNTLSAQGRNNILLNLSGVTAIDTSGIGELVSAFTTIRRAGGELKLLTPSPSVHDLLEITKLYTVFNIQEDESAAIAAFSR